ncbi:MAG: TonB-dependent receptor [Chitinispirillaceae bacterium]|nr:TonB-dependent receptor [Chitinispirillaceae bacterium]
MPPNYSYRVIRLFLPIIFITAAAVVSGTPGTGLLPAGVFDKSSGTPISRATVCLEDISLCLASDTAGRLHFVDIPVGRYNISASANGFSSVRIPDVIINPGENTFLRIDMTTAAEITSLDTLTVSMQRITAKKAEQTASITRLDAFSIQHTAGSANDVCHVLQTVPSVISAAADNQTALFVRGGHSRENCFIVDGIEIGNISHFSDRTSSGGAGSAGFIDGTYIKSLDFYTGSFPATLPSKMSAIADIQIREGSRTDRKYKIEVAEIGAGLTAEGPLFRQRASYLATGRYLDIRPLKSVLKLKELGRFGDGLIKLNMPLNPRHSLNLTAVGAYDFTEPVEADPLWNFSVRYLASGLQWKYSTEKVTNRLHISGVERKEWLDVAGGKEFCVSQEVGTDGGGDEDETGSGLSTGCLPARERWNYKRAISDAVLKLKDDAVRYLRDNDQFGIGIYVMQARFNFSDNYWKRITAESAADSADSTGDSLISSSTGFSGYDTIVGGYLNYVFREGHLKVVAGCRADHYRNSRQCGISPRCALSWELPRAGTVALSAGLYYQGQAGMTDLFNAVGKLREGKADVLPGINGKDIELQRSRQGVLSWEKQFAPSHSVIVEAYYKWYDREYTLVNPTTYLFEEEYLDAAANNRPWRLSPPRGNKKAYGVELAFLKKQLSGLYYSVGYSLFSVQNRYADGRWRNDSNNVRNNLVLTAGYQFFRHHGISLRVNFHEGRPYCTVIGFDSEKPVYDTKVGYYTERYEPFLMVSARYNFTLFPKFGTVTGYVDLWNILNKKHLYWKTPEGEEVRGNGILPVIGITVEF